METQLIRGNTKLIGLLGNPVAHSLSPLFQNHALAKLDLPYVYIPLRVDQKDLHTALHALRAFDFAGANVTIPYKKSVLPYCDVLSELSMHIEAVNTLYVREGLLYGTSTDADGFFRALQDIDHDVTGGSVVILGNGGTARTLAFSCILTKNIERLTLIGRNHERISALAEEIKKKTSVTCHTALFDTTACKEALASCTLCVNTTSVGMHPDVDASPLPKEAFDDNMVVFDTIYNPAETLFLQHAKRAGCIAQNGLGMLLYQGLESFTYWTGQEVSPDLFVLEELQALIK